MVAEPKWDLDGCCKTEESIFLGLYAVYYVIIILLWRTALLKPLKLLSVFVHEMGHAGACIITGGWVKEIEVYEDEGGGTGSSGGIRCLVIPAGYVGGAFWGGAFVALSGNRIGATIAAGIILAALLISLWYVGSWTMGRDHTKAGKTSYVYETCI
jgi:predicted MFS family arabinose efflux permease